MEPPGTDRFDRHAKKKTACLLAAFVEVFSPGSLSASSMKIEKPKPQRTPEYCLPLLVNMILLMVRSQ
jgi:hypothetical protein